jgi:hypothetical protein
MDMPSRAAHHLYNLEPRAVMTMGDKSPKAKEKSKQQHMADKNRKNAAAVDKAKPAAPAFAKKGK